MKFKPRNPLETLAEAFAVIFSFGQYRPRSHDLRSYEERLAEYGIEDGIAESWRRTGNHLYKALGKEQPREHWPRRRRWMNDRSDEE